MRPFIAAFLCLAALAAPATRRRGGARRGLREVPPRGGRGRPAPRWPQYAPAAQRTELLSMSAAQKSAMVKMLAATMPRAFTLRNKTVNPDGKSARLLVSGPGESRPGEKPETLYGTVRMVMEGGDWKVGDVRVDQRAAGGARRGARGNAWRQAPSGAARGAGEAGDARARRRRAGGLHLRPARAQARHGQGALRLQAGDDRGRHRELQVTSSDVIPAKAGIQN